MEVYNSNIESIKKDLENRGNLVIATHYDADGCYSAALLSEVYEILGVYIPEIFQDYCYFKARENEEVRMIDVALDLGQSLYKEFSGIVLDHHDHIDPWYPLIWDNVPTGLIVYTVFKEEIPKEHHWKVVGALVGDGQPELVPDEIWREFPILLEERTSIYKSYGKLREYPQIVYQMLSSPVNAMCRLGNAIEAIKIIKRAKNPDDILQNAAMKNDKDTVRKEEDRILSEYNILKTIGNLVSIMEIESNARMASRIAGKLQASNPRRTYVVVNTKRREISIRGQLATFIGRGLKESGFHCGGHPGYMGGHLDEKQTIEELVETIRSVLK